MFQDTNILNYVVIFGVCSEMDVIFVDFSKKNLNNPYTNCNG